LIQLLADVLSADMSDVKLDSVFLFENYRLVILIVVVSLTQLSLNDVIADEIIKINHFSV
jgi:hypothetical protein